MWSKEITKYFIGKLSVGDAVRAVRTVSLSPTYEIESDRLKI
ncbi:MAG: hypothetical protein AAGE96_21025 [Cyanobacteria bacterium P01_G01_bin.19]